jgi:hypothetical protein
MAILTMSLRQGRRDLSDHRARKDPLEVWVSKDLSDPKDYRGSKGLPGFRDLWAPKASQAPEVKREFKAPRAPQDHRA